jgi:hypothetical protein
MKLKMYVVVEKVNFFKKKIIKNTYLLTYYNYLKLYKKNISKNFKIVHDNICLLIK